MPHRTPLTRIETLAQAIVAGQERYQRCTPLFERHIQVLAQGNPVAPGQLARALHHPLDEILAILRAHPELEYDAQGDIVGSGLTLLPTPHQFHVEDRALFTWCAMDTLSYPIWLKRVAHVTSRCPATGRAIHFTVTPEEVLELDPPCAVVSLIVPDARDTAACCQSDRGGQNGRRNVREDVCNHGHFFVSRAAATRWQAMHPRAVILPVKEAHRVSALVEAYHARARQDP